VNPVFSAKLGLKNPFGEVCCEDEVALLQERFKDYYFDQVPFNGLSLKRDVYLIVGRRGSGKTSLGQYFCFQDKIKDACCIDVDEPKIYQDVLSKVARFAAVSSDVAIPRIVGIWEFIIWSLIFREYKDMNEVVAAAAVFGEERGTASNAIRSILRKLLSKFFMDDKEELADELENLLSSEVITRAKAAVGELTIDKPVIISIDTLEHYDVGNEPIMRATAALIECASNFNTLWASKGVLVKVFISAEVFPYLMENVISNPSKYVRKPNPIYLYWRPRDLIRLLCWRFYLYLGDHSLLPLVYSHNLDWTNFKEVWRCYWKPYFQESLLNSNGLREMTFPYVLRHTQMRPRQVIMICNEISERAKARGTFPNFPPDVIVEAVKSVERLLANELINSFKSVYPNVGEIVNALYGKPKRFKGNLLDKVSKDTASAWPQGDYSPLKFRKLVSELGIVGRVRKVDERSGIISADFEYFMEDRLPLQTDDDCVVHPMFYERLNINYKENLLKVYPFPEHHAFADLLNYF
jgi:hypothetical protein